MVKLWPMKPTINLPPPKKTPIIIYGVFLLCVYMTYLTVEFNGIRIMNFNSKDQERDSADDRSTNTFYHK